jgi:hypothetical protein
VNGRKRHILVDTNGLLLKIVVHAAGLSESEGGCLLLHGLAIVFPRLRHLWTDRATSRFLSLGLSSIWAGRLKWSSHPIRHAVTLLRPCATCWVNQNSLDATRPDSVFCLGGGSSNEPYPGLASSAVSAKIMNSCRELLKLGLILL